MAGREGAPQVDIGSLSLNGLAAFAPVLATLSANNVTSMAMIQLQILGALFHINREFAAKVPDLLQRCSSVRPDRLAMAIGWRKGDAASLMAESAGEQAVSLLSVCLASLYGRDQYGSILCELCQKLLPTSTAIPSVAQIANAAELLSGKLATLGFGNFLTRQVVKIHKIYENLDRQVPEGLLEKITDEGMIELLFKLSRAQWEESEFVRIVGMLEWAAC